MHQASFRLSRCTFAHRRCLRRLEQEGRCRPIIMWFAQAPRKSPRDHVRMHGRVPTGLGRDNANFKRQEKTLECLLGEPPACVHVFCELNIFRKAILPHCQVPRGSTGATPLLRLHLVSTPLALGSSFAESQATQRAPQREQGLRIISAQAALLGSPAFLVSAEAQCPSPPFPFLREPPLLPLAEFPAAVPVSPTPSFRTCLRRVRFRPKPLLLHLGRRFRFRKPLRPQGLAPAPNASQSRARRAARTQREQRRGFWLSKGCVLI